VTEPFVHGSGDGPPAMLVHGTFWCGCWPSAPPRSTSAWSPPPGFPRCWWSGQRPANRHRVVRAAGQTLVEALVQRTGVEVVVFDGSGHLPPAEEAERFNDLPPATWAVPGTGRKW
jgi:hypothetical protein